MSRASRMTTAPLTPARPGDLERLFGPRGACAGCWWNRRAFRRLVRRGTVPGVRACMGAVPPRARPDAAAHRRGGGARPSEAARGRGLSDRAVEVADGRLRADGTGLGVRKTRFAEGAR